MKNNSYHPKKVLEHKKAIELEISQRFKDVPLKKQFMTVYLQSLAPRLLQHQSLKITISFLESRYAQFKSLVESTSTQLLEIKQLKNSSSYSLELICHDAQYLIFTLESIFNQYQLKITKIFHPLLSVYVNSKNKITLINYPKKDSQLISATYIEFENINTSLCIDELKNSIDKSIQAVHAATKDHADLQTKIIDVQQAVAKHPSSNKELHSEWVALMDWLTQENFSLFGYAKFKIKKNNATFSISKQKESNLGILNDAYINNVKSTLGDTIHKQSKIMADYRSPFVFDTVPFKSPIKRYENLMRLSLKIPHRKNEWVEHNFVGLLKRSSVLAKNLSTPIIRHKMKRIFKAKQFWPGSHSYNQTVRFLNPVPKFELFRTATENLQQLIEDLMSITNPNDIYVFTRQKINKNKLFLMVVIPTELASRHNIELIKSELDTSIPHSGIESVNILTEQLCRIHFYFDQPNMENWFPNLTELENKIKQLIKPWDIQLKDCLSKQFDSPTAEKYFKKYSQAFPTHHKVRRSAEQTVSDILYFEKCLASQNVQFNLAPFNYKDSLLSNKASLLFIYHTQKIDLFHFIPIFQNLNLYFFDELTTRIGSLDKMFGYIHAFRVCHIDKRVINVEQLNPILTPLLSAIFKEKLPNDPVNGLATAAFMEWKHIFIVQAYRNYLLQLNPTYTKSVIDTTIVKHSEIMKLFISYFLNKFNYKNQSKPNTAQIKKNNELKKIIENAIYQVSDIDEDYILRWIFNLIEHTVRTNFFQLDFETRKVLSLKFNCEKLKIPQPKPYKEIFVFSTEVEGIHIRFGPVSRGGIRWSTRLNDYRNEVLGLAATQRVKNVVIVPNGSKGGFVIKKQLPPQELRTESSIQYQLFIQSLLDVTDSLDSNNSIIKPSNVVCYDDDDTYLVVAADKGTATFSDLANSIAKKHPFWLDDAFASGGSKGYNHKDMGITAKGAWECVKLHFLESGKDIQKEPFTVVGVGDMSGDVFGNGMLLSQSTCLVAAFNHLHIFIDPTPHPLKSWKERQRLFNMPQSQWTDYSKKIMSKGGGIFNRSDKVITISEEIQQLLNINKSQLNGDELIHEILKMNVDLLWFGGIGTYVKSDNESNFDVSDIMNDNIRINASECQASVIGEGANLGITQLARLEMSRASIKLNTDFIDNSAGVNTSDYEVNLKIFLQMLQRKGIVKSDTVRNNLLEKACNDVSNYVLKNNQSQHQLLSMEEYRSRHSMIRYKSLIQTLINKGLLNPKTDEIPSQTILDELESKQDPLPRPLLALLQSLVKLEINEALIQSDILEHHMFDSLYESYFPEIFYKKFNKELHSHPLKKEITATLLTNLIINQSGILFIQTIQEVSKESIPAICFSYYLLYQLYDCPTIHSQILSSELSYNEKYNQILTTQEFLGYSVIESFLTFNISFHIDDYDTISMLFKRYLADSKQYAISSSAHPLEQFNDFIEYYSAQCSNGKSLTGVIPVLKCIDQLFNFSAISSRLKKIRLTNQWDLEQFILIKKIFYKKKFELTQKLSKISQKSTLHTQDDILSHVSNDIDTYLHDLDIIIHTDLTSLTGLTVLINKLNLIIIK